LPLQQYPTISSPTVTIESTLPGASPEIIETTLTKVLEDAVSSIEGVDNVESTSNAEESKVIVTFNPDRPIVDAVNDIRDKLAKNHDKLPLEASQPILTKSRAEDKAIIMLALTS
ncbi:efflux RND transporter permease subunit, partial [Dolichospermum sp. ST_sed4]|nr:efflux RND transporter permease subunit [Dolichospermum sp. ST_sed4]